MTDPAPEIKPSLARFFWIQFLSFGLVFVPLAIGAVLWSIYGLEVPRANALNGLAVFGGVALVAMAVVAYVIAQRITHRLESVRGVVGQMASGEFDKRIPPEHRQQIEGLAA